MAAPSLSRRDLFSERRREYIPLKFSIIAVYFTWLAVFVFCNSK